MLRLMTLPLLVLVLVCSPFRFSAEPASTLTAVVKPDEFTRVFRVTMPGLVSIPLSALPDASRPEHLHVRRRGLDVPVELSDGTIRLLAEGNSSRFSAESVYWVTAETTPGARTTLPATLLASFSWERDDLYQPVAATTRGDRWFAGELRTTTVPFSVTLDLPTQLAPGNEIQLHLAPLVRREGHRIYASVGGVLVGTAYWGDAAAPGARVVPLTLIRPLPAGRVQLDLALTSVGAPDDLVLLDRLDIPSLRVPLPMLPTPELLPVAAHDVHEGPALGQPGAGYLIITHQTFRPALDPLIAAHRQRGDEVGVVDVQDIYDQFSYGERDPEAIRRFVGVALASWNPAPRAVLLVGAGSVRLRVEQGADDPTFIPPYLVDADPKYGEVACDTCYARTAGDVRNQPVPAVPVGRFPVHTLAEAHTLVTKTVTALTSPPPGAWRGKALLVADNDEQDGVFAGTFSGLAERAAPLLSKLRAERYFYAPDAASLAAGYHDPDALRHELFASWDSGAALMLYVGHASMWQWAFTSAEAATPQLVGLYDADTRTNGARLPILLSMDCLSGNWANPVLQPIDERLLLKEGGGIVAALTPVGSGVNTGHATLLDSALPVLNAGRRLGEAHVVGLRTLGDTGQNADLLYTFGILGDPDLSLPSVSTVFVPFVQRTSSLDSARVGQNGL